MWVAFPRTSTPLLASWGKPHLEVPRRHLADFGWRHLAVFAARCCGFNLLLGQAPAGRPGAAVCRLRAIPDSAGCARPPLAPRRPLAVYAGMLSRLMCTLPRQQWLRRSISPPTCACPPPWRRRRARLLWKRCVGWGARLPVGGPAAQGPQKTSQAGAVVRSACAKAHTEAGTCAGLIARLPACHPTY